MKIFFTSKLLGGIPVGALIAGFDPTAPATSGSVEEFCDGSDISVVPPSVVHEDKSATKINDPIIFFGNLIPDNSKYFDYS
jgi:hypothetical protein